MFDNKSKKKLRCEWDIKKRKKLFFVVEMIYEFQISMYIYIICFYKEEKNFYSIFLFKSQIFSFNIIIVSLVYFKNWESWEIKKKIFKFFFIEEENLRELKGLLL